MPKGKGNKPAKKSRSGEPKEKEVVEIAEKGDSGPSLGTQSPVIPPQGTEEAAPEENDAPDVVVEDEVLELLAFRLSDEEYAIDILKVEEIIRLGAITKIPRAPHLVMGIISLRGTVIPIIDIKRRLGLDNREEGRKTRVIITTMEQGIMGFIADEVLEVMKVEKSRVEPSANLPSRGDSDHLRGVVRVDDKMIILLDIDRAASLE